MKKTGGWSKLSTLTKVALIGGPALIIAGAMKGVVDMTAAGDTCNCSGGCSCGNAIENAVETAAESISDGIENAAESIADTVSAV